MTDARDTLKKMGLFGIGVISLTQEKIEEFTEEMIKRGEISREEGKTFVKQVLSEKDKQIADIEATINEKVRDVLKNSGVAMKEDLERLEKRIEVLERTTVMRVDIDILERRIKELEQTIRPMTE